MISLSARIRDGFRFLVLVTTTLVGARLGSVAGCGPNAEWLRNGHARLRWRWLY
jgi:hypothetical protein